ncbi:putative protein N(5)-glutamine methyltransferase [Herbiconiux liangxiaofengii]|uniref:putative protein N(5)-glutamine methyltransferase n=1 Tax=Herbiconiux liangxiaofengii TaxID=3342795 RepID=UPI0035B90DEB
MNGNDSRGERERIAGELRRAGCVFAEEEADVILRAAGGDSAAVRRFVAERVGGRPLEHVVGWAEFAGLRVVVGPGVFVPRRRTELLVRVAVAEAPAGAVVVDLCCGSGAIGAAISAYGDGRIRVAASADGEPTFVLGTPHPASTPGFEVYAADIDPAAVAAARQNLGTGRVFEGDLYEALPAGLRGRVHVLAVNAPYVPTEAIGMMPAEARLYEAAVALDGGGDGLDVQRRVVAGAAEWLAQGGRLLIETSEQQAPLTAALFEAAGLRPRIQRDDDLDATVVVGTR